jgi:hypothetical protein
VYSGYILPKDRKTMLKLAREGNVESFDHMIYIYGFVSGRESNENTAFFYKP